MDNPEQEIFLFSKMPRSTLGPTQPSVQWVVGARSLKKIGQEVRPTTHVHLGTQQNSDSFIFSPPEDCSEVLYFHIKKFRFSQQLFNEDSNIKLCKKSSSGSQVDKRGQMKGHM